MATIVFTLVVDYTILATLVGVSLAWLLMLRDQEKLGIPGSTALVALFAALDLFWIPAVATLDATLTIGNAAVVDFFALDGPVSVNSLLAFDPLDLPVWIAQAIVALVTAQLLLSHRRSLP